MDTLTIPPKALPLEMLEKIIHFSDVDSIKIFRLVSRACNKIALPILRKFSKVCLSSVEMISNFNAMFVSLEVENLPFDSIKFVRETSGTPWETSELNTFFELWGHIIKYLEFYKAIINIPVSEATDDKIAYRLSPAIQRNLTTLILDCTRSRMIEVEVDHLMTLKTIKLSNVALRMGTKSNLLTPTVIALNNMSYCRSDGRWFTPVQVCEFIDFSLAKKVTIRERTFLRGPRVFLDMTKKITVVDLTLRNVGIQFGNANKWIVKGLLSLSQIPWLDSNALKFTSLDFRDADIDVSKLPQTVEYLRLANSSDIQLELHCLDVKQSDTETTLPNLKFLSTNLHWSFPKGFTNCDKVTEVDLSDCCVPEEDDIRYEYEADEAIHNGVEFEKLPCNIRKMQIHPRGVFYSLVEDRPRLEVDTLIVDGWLMPSSLKETPRKIKPQKLVLMLINMTPSLEEWGQLLEDINKNHNSMVIYLGPVELRHVHILSKYFGTSAVDYPESHSSNPKQYYFKFETNLGNAISKSEFDQMSNLSRGNLPLSLAF